MYYTPTPSRDISEACAGGGAGAHARSVGVHKAEPFVLGPSKVGTFGNRSAVLLHRTVGLRDVLLEHLDVLPITASDREIIDVAIVISTPHQNSSILVLP